MATIREIHEILLNFEKRAENKPDDIISQTFVDAAPLVDVICAPLNQIMFGRRGTGKTHALRFSLARAKELGETAVYLDLRSIGSNTSFYADEGISRFERGLSVVTDILEALHDELLQVALLKIASSTNPEQITLRIDDFSNAISEVKLSGTPQIEETSREKLETERSLQASGQASNAGFDLDAKATIGRRHSQEVESKLSHNGYVRSIDFGRVQVSLAGLLAILGIKKFWLLIDEWSELPREVQPYLADLIRKTLLPTRGIVVKIAAIEQRSSFVEARDNGRYIGLELGSDIAADLNLDEFLVFDYDEAKALDFFRELLYKNYIALGGDPADVKTSTSFVGQIFTEKRAFEEFVRAVEGVPRDALNLISKAVMKSFGEKIGVDVVRRAALDWYQADKIKVVSSSPDLQAALNHIIDEIIGTRKARAFLFPSNTRHRVIERLYDSRVLHLLKKNISARDEPGKRYDAWKIDYGCYVDLIRTQNAPLGLFEGDEGFVHVPEDDYRSIRRAVLLPEDLDNYLDDPGPL